MGSFNSANPDDLYEAEALRQDRAYHSELAAVTSDDVLDAMGWLEAKAPEIAIQRDFIDACLRQDAALYDYAKGYAEVLCKVAEEIAYDRARVRRAA